MNITKEIRAHVDAIRTMFIENVKSAIGHKLEPSQVENSFLMLFKNTMEPMLIDLAETEAEFKKRSADIYAQIEEMRELRKRIESSFNEGEEWKQ